MLQIEQQDPDSIPDNVLRAMFAARKAVFVDLLRWDVPVLDGQFEVDQFDTPHATYLVLTDRTGMHLGSARLLPTTQPHILGSLYAGLCADPPPRGPAIFEITRFCLDRRLRAPERRMVRDALVVALVDHARRAGIERYTAIAEMGWFQQILAFGWRCLPLGMPQNYDGSMLAALEIVITPDTARQLAGAGIVADRTIRSDAPRVAA